MRKLGKIEKSRGGTADEALIKNKLEIVTAAAAFRRECANPCCCTLGFVSEKAIQLSPRLRNGQRVRGYETHYILLIGTLIGRRLSALLNGFPR